MTDPLDALREPARAVDPDPGFAARLRERLERLVLTGEDPTVTTVETQTAPDRTALHTLTPYLAVPDARAAVDFYVRAFGGARRDDPIVMPDGRVGHVEVALSGSVLMLADEFPEIGLRAPVNGENSVSLRLEVPDPDAVVDRAVALGARLERPVTDSPYGRGGVVTDPAGHRWMISREPGRTALAYASMWTPDADAAATFYGAVLGWSVDADHPGASHQVAELSAPMGIFGGQDPTLYCCWTVDDLDAAVALVRAAGGTAGDPVTEPFGRVAECVDDQGVRFALVGEAGPRRDTTGPGELAYVTLEFPDAARARAFYGTVLGWGFTPGREPGHWNVSAGDLPMGVAGGRAAAAVPMFAVPDVHAAVATVRAAGGTATDPADEGYALAAECTDDQGARFHIAQF